MECFTDCSEGINDTSTTSLQFHRRFSCLLKSWYSFFMFFKTYSMVKWANNIYYCAAPFLAVYNYDVWSHSNLHSFHWLCLLIILPVSGATKTQLLAKSPVNTFKHIYQPDRVSSFCIPSELISFTLSPCD